LYYLGAPWFRNARGTTNISHLEEYAQAEVYKYFVILLGVALGGVVINLLPPVRDWVESIEEEAANALKTPESTPRIIKCCRNTDQDFEDEETALVEVEKYQSNLEYGSGLF
jgi:hypothetical protein